MNCYVIHVSHHKRNSSIIPEMSFVMTKRSPLPVMPTNNQVPRQYNSRVPSLAGTKHRQLWSPRRRLVSPVSGASTTPQITSTSQSARVPREPRRGSGCASEERLPTADGGQRRRQRACPAHRTAPVPPPSCSALCPGDCTRPAVKVPPMVMSPIYRTCALQPVSVCIQRAT